MKYLHLLENLTILQGDKPTEPTKPLPDAEKSDSLIVRGTDKTDKTPSFHDLIKCEQMTATKLFFVLESLGATITVREGVARCSAPEGTLTDELREAWQKHHVAITALLQLRTAWPTMIVPQGFGRPTGAFMMLHKRAQTLCGEFLSLRGEPLGFPYPMPARQDGNVIRVNCLGGEMSPRYESDEPFDPDSPIWSELLTYQASVAELAQGGSSDDENLAVPT